MSKTSDNIEVTTTPAIFGLTESGHATATSTNRGENITVTRSYYKDTSDAKNEAIREAVAEVRARRGE